MLVCAVGIGRICWPSRLKFKCLDIVKNIYDTKRSHIQDWCYLFYIVH
jgi:hypothetical protein